MATLNLAEVLPLTDAELEKFFRWVHVLPGSRGCHIWTGVLSSRGHGRFQLRGCSVRSHRLAWIIRSKAELPEGALVLHSCDVPACCNPDHLFLGSDADSQLDKARKGRGVASLLGMPYGVAEKSGNLRRPFGVRVTLGGKDHNLGHYETAKEAGRVALDFKLAFLEKPESSLRRS